MESKMNFIINEALTILGIVLLMSFIPLTVYSFRRFRLPKKQREYEIIMDRLHEQRIEGIFPVAVLDNEYSTKDYLLPVIFVSVLSFFGFYVLLKGNPPLLLIGTETVSAQSANGATKLSLVAIGWSFLGSYVWAIQYIFRRLVTIDLHPSTYYSIGTRMLFSIFIALVLYHFISALPGGEKVLLTLDVGSLGLSKSILPVVAFVTGIFPQRALQYIIDRFKFTASAPGKQAEEMPLDMLEGMEAFHKLRLSEVGIDNVQNLAQASLVELILRTPFRPAQIIDWIVQAKLCLYFKTDVQKLRKAGVRTILGLKILGDNDKLSNVSKFAEIDQSYLESVYTSIKNNNAIDRLAKAEDCLHTV